ncbi:hypothetical protein DFO77_102203 [Marinilabilia salmonicolor]|uniref:Uncharacterized protein n=1 Tax=Marinilabilia salmonicolor TaxID=989 RepID=A0A368VD37_9BACT|nr:hypothetical protein DFO77_102203 [Marinilabilia salmonicolor]
MTLVGFYNLVAFGVLGKFGGGVLIYGVSVLTESFY